MTNTTNPERKTPETEPAAPKTAPKKATRQQQLHKLLCRKSGVTIAQLQKAFDWQPHTARAAISTLRKTGQHIERSKAGAGTGFVYRIAREG